MSSQVRLTSRDEHLLFFLWQNRFVTIRQLTERFFADASDKWVHARLRALEEANLLKVQPNRFLRETLVRDRKAVYITAAGIAALIESEFLDPSLAKDTPVRGRQIPDEYAPSLVHDVQVVDLRLALWHTLPITRWRSDHELRLARRQAGTTIRVPDGEFTFETPDGEVLALLENERATYSCKTFQAILERLRRQYDKHMLFFVTPSAEHLTSLLGWAERGAAWEDARAQLLFGVYAAVTEYGARAPWVSLNGPLAASHSVLQGLALADQRAAAKKV